MLKKLGRRVWLANLWQCGWRQWITTQRYRRKWSQRRRKWPNWQQFWMLKTSSWKWSKISYRKSRTRSKSCKRNAMRLWLWRRNWKKIWSKQITVWWVLKNWQFCLKKKESGGRNKFKTLPRTFFVLLEMSSYLQRLFLTLGLSQVLIENRSLTCGNKNLKV